VNNDPCAKLSGAEFQRCIRGTPNIPIDPKPPIKGPVTGGGDVRPGGTGSTGHNPVGGPIGVVNPTKPNVIFHPNGPRIDGPKIIRDNGPSNKLTTTTMTPIRPNPVTLGPGGGGISKSTVGASLPPANNARVQKQTIIR
jgi:hypothetical protein